MSELASGISHACWEVRVASVVGCCPRTLSGMGSLTKRQPPSVRHQLGNVLHDAAHPDQCLLIIFMSSREGAADIHFTGGALVSVPGPSQGVSTCRSSWLGCLCMVFRPGCGYLRDCWRTWSPVGRCQWPFLAFSSVDCKTCWSWIPLGAASPGLYLAMVSRVWLCPEHAS